MIARPTAASAAATAMVKMTNPSPKTVSVSRANATRLRLTAFIISSTHMNMISKLRRINTPINPITNSAALRKRKWLVVNSVMRTPWQSSSLPVEIRQDLTCAYSSIASAANGRVEIGIAYQDDLSRCFQGGRGILVGPCDWRRRRRSFRQCHVGATRMTKGDRGQALPQPLRQGQHNGAHDADEEHQGNDLEGQEVLGKKQVADDLGATTEEID